jgi:hypothetical protein
VRHYQFILLYMRNMFVKTKIVVKGIIKYVNLVTLHMDIAL